MSAPVGAWHRLQPRSNWCVATCFEMCAARAGVVFDSTGLAPDSPKGFDLDAFCVPGLEVLSRRVLPLDVPGLQELRAALAQPAWVIVEVCGPMWVQAISSEPHPVFGKLCAPGAFGEPFHSVVVIDDSADGFLVLDPFIPSPVPLTVRPKALIDCLNGRNAVCRI